MPNDPSTTDSRPPDELPALAATPPAPSDNATTPAAPPPPEAAVPRPPVPRRYELKKLLGSGGMGDVWLGRDRRLKRPVAVKVVQPRWAGHQNVFDRFVEEAQLTSQLQHPAIPPVYEMGQLPDGRPYFCMKVVRGRTLASLLEKRAGPGDDLPRLLGIFEQVCQAVAYAHSKGVIHRDLKPANVMVGPFGEVQAMDWGLAKVLTGEAGRERERPEAAASVVETDRTQQADSLTQAGAVLGTFAYMPPEQARGEVGHLDRRCDVFGLGAILCELLTGKAPYEGSSEEVRLCAQLGQTQGALERLAACPADGELMALARSCLSAKAAERPADAGAVASAVGAYRAAVQQRLHQAELAEAEARARQEEARRTAEAEARGAVARRTRNLSVALVVVLLLGSGAALTFGVVAARRAEDARAAQANAEEERGKAEQAQQSEKAQRELAEQRKTEADQSAERARQEHDRAERLLYARELALALREWETNNAAGAWQHLETTREGFRGWEYRYLVTLFNSNQRTLRGHTAPVWAVAFAADGTRLASAGGDGTLRVWDAESGREVFSLNDNGGSLSSVAFSHDGTRLAGAGMGRTVRVWDAASGREVHALTGHGGPVRSLAFAPDGKRLASTSLDGTVRVWDVEAGREVLSFKGPAAYSNGLVFSPDGKRLAGAYGPGTVGVWDAESGRELLTLRGPTTAALRCVAFRPDGRRLVAGSAERRVWVWDAEKGGPVLSTLSGHTLEVDGVAYSPDGQRLASTGLDGTVRVWDVEAGREVHLLRGHVGAVNAVAYSPDGKHLATAGADRTVRLWDADKSQGGLTIAPVNTGLLPSVAFDPGGRRVASGGGYWVPKLHRFVGGAVKVWDAETGRELLTLVGQRAAIRGVAFSPNGNRIASVGPEGTVKVWDVEAGRDVLTLNQPPGFSAATYSPDGKRLATAGTDRTVRLWDAETGEELLTLTGHEGQVLCVAFSPDGKRLASAGLVRDPKQPRSFSREMKVWDAQTGQATLTLQGEDLPSAGLLAFSPDGRRLAGACLAHGARVWDVETGRQVLSLKGHTGQVSCVAYCPDGKRLATGGADRTVKLWDVEDGLEVLSLSGHAGAVYALAFSPDGRRLASSSRDEMLRVWDASLGDEKPGE
jgi:WD40 repeat protein